MYGVTLVILAAGKGNRFGGLKQLHTFQPQNATLAEFALWDALQAGFDHFVAIVSESTRAYFESVFEKMHIKDRACCVLQKSDERYPNRVKPWGTGHALLSAVEAIHTPFVIVNSDDFYGRKAYYMAQTFLQNNKKDFALVGYPLKETLSEHGYVSRGLCLTKKDRVISIEEHTHIETLGNELVSGVGMSAVKLDPESFVSMNFWILQHFVLRKLEAKWHYFIEHLKDPQNDEFFLPNVIWDIAHEQETPIRLLKNFSDDWLGITYAGDVQKAQNTLSSKTSLGLYPAQFIGH